MSLPINELGKYRANPYAQATNVLKLAGCEDCGDATICEDLVSEAVVDSAAEFFESFTYDGTVYTADAPINVLDVDAIQLFMSDAISLKEINVSVTVTWEDGTPPAGTITIQHIGEGSVTDVTFTVIGSVAPARCCEAVNIIDWRITQEGTIPNFVYDGVAEALANNPYAYTGTPATDAATAVTLAADVETALTNLGVAYIAVTVTVNDAVGAYDISYTSTDVTPVIVGGVCFDACTVAQGFVCP